MSAVSEQTSERAQSIVVISARRLIAEALHEVLQAQPSVEECVVISSHPW